MKQRVVWSPAAFSSPSTLGARPPRHWGPWGTAPGTEAHSIIQGKEMSEVRENPHLRIGSLINTVFGDWKGTI